jgi:hypothetical protein
METRISRSKCFSCDKSVINQAKSVSRRAAIARKTLKTLDLVSNESKEEGVNFKNAKLQMLMQCFGEVNSIESLEWYTYYIKSIDKRLLMAKACQAGEKANVALSTMLRGLLYIGTTYGSLQ